MAATAVTVAGKVMSVFLAPILAVGAGIWVEGPTDRRSVASVVALAATVAISLASSSTAIRTVSAFTCVCFLTASRFRALGLTGGIACGKSSVARILRAEGVPVIDADEIAREVVLPGAWGHRRLVARFGRKILNADGTVNRMYLRSITLGEHGSTQNRRLLNEATHLPIAARILWLMLRLGVWENHDVVCLDAPLLFETGMDRLCRLVWVVHCSPATQVLRLMARDGVGKVDAQANIDTQWPLAKKLAAADVKISNDGDLATLRVIVLDALRHQGGQRPLEGSRHPVVAGR